MKPVRFDSEANDEFRAAATYYEDQRPGLGTDFAEAVERAVERIASAPQIFPPHQASGTRKCVLRRFPYTIFFPELDECIWIAAVAHQKRRPGYWSHRRPNGTD